MQIKREGDRTPLPGLSKDGFFFDTESDPLGARLVVAAAVAVVVLVVP
jgi:hypothetical protein